MNEKNLIDILGNFATQVIQNLWFDTKPLYMPDEHRYTLTGGATYGIKNGTKIADNCAKAIMDKIREEEQGIEYNRLLNKLERENMELKEKYRRG